MLIDRIGSKRWQPPDQGAVELEPIVAGRDMHLRALIVGQCVFLLLGGRGG
jgi:hypothetical protein